jgi:hypothetical protein
MPLSDLASEAENMGISERSKLMLAMNRYSEPNLAGIFVGLFGILLHSATCGHGI